VLGAHPAPDAPEEARRAWAARLMDALNELVRRAPESEAVLDLAERAQRVLGGS
jgi:truncated hemoglobin YjbI